MDAPSLFSYFSLIAIEMSPPPYVNVVLGKRLLAPRADNLFFFGNYRGLYGLCSGRRYQSTRIQLMGEAVAVILFLKP